ncbi:MAG: ParA family protein [Alphaproteobacteria bacterium]|nr:ParA family protein [Alphaproteobacteria bacterium]
MSDAERPAAAPVRILAVANQKGGVGKTTTAINLGTALAAVGERVLIVDLDPQGNASTGLGIARKQGQQSTYHVLMGEATLAKVVVGSGMPRLDCAPSTMDLLGAELELAEIDRKTYRLADAIAALQSESAEGYSYILVDCPPSLNLLTINALSAADAVLVPLQCEFFALEGLSQLLKTVERVKANLNRKLSIQGVVLTMFDRRNSLSEQVADDVRSVLGDKVYETVIPRNVRISEAPSYGKPVLLYDNACTGAQAYIKLASEVIRRERQLRAA